MESRFWLFGIIVYLVSALVVYLMVRYQHGPHGDRQDEIPSIRHLFFTFVPFINTLAAAIVIISVLTYGIDIGNLSGFFGVKKTDKTEEESK